MTRLRGLHLIPPYRYHTLMSTARCQNISHAASSRRAHHHRPSIPSGTASDLHQVPELSTRAFLSPSMSRQRTIPSTASLSRSESPSCRRRLFSKILKHVCALNYQTTHSECHQHRISTDRALHLSMYRL